MISYLDFVLDRHPLFGQFLGILLFLTCVTVAWFLSSSPYKVEEWNRRFRERFGDKPKTEDSGDIEINISVTIEKQEEDDGIRH